MRLRTEDICAMREADYVTFASDGGRALAICVRFAEGSKHVTRVGLGEILDALEEPRVVYSNRLGALWGPCPECMDLDFRVGYTECEEGTIGHLFMTEGRFCYSLDEWVV